MSSRHLVIDSDLGPITLAADGGEITGLYFDRHVRRPAQATFGPEATNDPLLQEAARQLRDYLSGARTEFDLPLAADGNDFQTAVWAVVTGIPRGATTTYGHIAEQLGDRALAQKVGQAVGANPLCVFVPCHRVVGADGSLTGYAGGLEIKRRLLELEEPAPVSAGRLF